MLRPAKRSSVYITVPESGIPGKRVLVISNRECVSTAMCKKKNVSNAMMSSSREFMSIREKIPGFLPTED